MPESVTNRYRDDRRHALRGSIVVATFLVAAVLAGATNEAHGQEAESERVRDRVFLPLALIGGVPVGEFSESVDFGYGLSAGLVFHLDRRRMVGLRLDASFLEYGRKTRGILLTDPLVGIIDLDIVTENSIAAVGVGPQFTVPGEVVRPYVFATAGFAYFWTQSFLGGAADTSNVERTTNLDDLTFSVAAAGGLLFRVHQGRHPVYVDLSVSYRRNGTVTYMAEESVRYAPDGTLIVAPIESEANLVVFSVGVVLSIG